MLDNPESPFAVALHLASIVAYAEGKPFMTGTAEQNADRAYVLALYRECLEAVASKSAVFTPGR